VLSFRQITVLSKMMGVKWKGLTDEQKAPYMAMAEKDKVRYKEEKAVWDQEAAVKRRQLEVQQHQQALYQQQYAQQYAQPQYQQQYAQPQYQQQYVQQVQPQQYAQQQYVQQQAQYASAGYQQQQASDLGWWQ
jgi:CHASE2 domain-containing sensor protein